MKALGDPNRFRIILMLLERPLCVCELLEVLDIAGGTLSNHLKILRTADLIDQQKDGRWIEYFISPEAPPALLAFIKEEAAHDSRAGADRCRIREITRQVCSEHMKSRTFLSTIQNPKEPS